jgi:hypothetical protein
MTETMTYPLRLPRSLKRAVERQSKEDRTSINQFVATAVAVIDSDCIYYNVIYKSAHIL